MAFFTLLIISSLFHSNSFGYCLCSGCSNCGCALQLMLINTNSTSDKRLSKNDIVSTKNFVNTTKKCTHSSPLSNSTRLSVKIYQKMKRVFPLKQILLRKRDLNSQNISPVLVLINCKSGGKVGKKLLNSFRSIFHKFQLCNVNKKNPVKYIKLFKSLFPKFLIVCCGGDGTISWTLKDIRANGVTNALINVVPLGTGNDLYNYLARVKQDLVKRPKHKLEATNIYWSRIDNIIQHPAEYVKYVDSSTDMEVDNWNITFYTIRRKPLTKLANKMKSFIKKRIHPNISLPRRSLPFQSLATKLQSMNQNHTVDCNHTYQFHSIISKYKLIKQKNMINYFGIGVDGAVSMAFDNLRKHYPSIFVSSLINKLWYGVVAFISHIFGSHRDLSECITMTCDGVPVQIPPGTKGIIILNINSYAGGCRMWRFGGEQREVGSTIDIL